MNQLDNDNWLKWLAHLKGEPHATGMEIGTFKGESAEWMLKNIFTHPSARYYCIDPFTGNEEHKIGNIDCSGLEAEARIKLKPYPQCVIIKDYSCNALRNFRGIFDFVFVDGAHDAMNVLRDSVLAFDCLKQGGIIVWDDYLWEVLPDPIDRPKGAIDAFLGCYSRKLNVISTGEWQVCAMKTHE